jgi:hypothetical protein
VGSKYKGSSGYRKITGNKCTGELYPSVERECKAIVQTPGQGTVRPPEDKDPEVVIMESANIVDNIYFLKDSNVVLMHTLEGIVHVSHDMGGGWTKDFAKEVGKVQGVFLHPYDNKRSYFTIQGAIWVNRDQFKQINRRKRAIDVILTRLSPNYGAVKLELNTLGVDNLVFSEINSEWLIFVGQPEKCDRFPTGCFTSAVVSWDSGSSWSKLDSWVTQCVFGRTKGFKPDGVGEKSVYCLAYQFKTVGKQGRVHGRGSKANPLQLVRYDQGMFSGVTKKVLIEQGAASFYEIANMFVVATVCGFWVM